MTEDDTFDALRRTPLKKLQDLMSFEAEELFELPIYESFNEHETAYLHRHGWSVLEFKRAWVEQLKVVHPELIHNYGWWDDFVKSIE